MCTYVINRIPKTVFLQLNKTSECRLQYDPTFMHTNDGYPHTKCIQFVYTAHTIIEYSVVERVFQITRNVNTMLFYRRARIADTDSGPRFIVYWVEEIDHLLFNGAF